MYTAALLSPLAKVEGTKVPDNISELLSILLILFCIAKAPIVSTSKTGETLSADELSCVVRVKLFVEPISFVSLIPDATSLGVLNALLSFNVIVVEVVSLVYEEPEETCAAPVAMNVVNTVVFGNSIVGITVCYV